MWIVRYERWGNVECTSKGQMRVYCKGEPGKGSVGRRSLDSSSVGEMRTLW